MRQLWTSADDAALRASISQVCGEERVRNWSAIALNVSGKCAKQCRERWNGHLQPKLSRATFTANEDRLLVEVVCKDGTAWAEHQRTHFPNRSQNMLKNRWHQIKGDAQPPQHTIRKRIVRERSNESPTSARTLFDEAAEAVDLDLELQRIDPIKDIDLETLFHSSS